MRTPHLVPLSKQALAILKQIKQFCGEHELIFIGDHDPRKPMSENTVNSALRVMGYDTKVEVCGHGFRTKGDVWRISRAAQGPRFRRW